jgi:hypothetical protein
MMISKLSRLMSYADALAAAIRRMSPIDIDGLKFSRREDDVTLTDYVTTGRHTMIYELAETGKQYRIMIEPVPETHR